MLLCSEVGVISASSSRSILPLPYLFWEVMLSPWSSSSHLGPTPQIYAAVKSFFTRWPGSILHARRHHLALQPYPAASIAVCPASFAGNPASWHHCARCSRQLGESFAFPRLLPRLAIKCPSSRCTLWLPRAPHVGSTDGRLRHPCRRAAQRGTSCMMRFCLPLFPAGRAKLRRTSPSSPSSPSLSATRRSVQPISKNCRLFQRQPPRLRRTRHLYLRHHRHAGRHHQMLAHGISTGALFLLVGML